MDDVHNWGYTSNQPPISFSIFFELFHFSPEKPENLIGGVVAFGLFGKVVLGEVDPSLLGVIIQSIVEIHFENGS